MKGKNGMRQLRLWVTVIEGFEDNIQRIGHWLSGINRLFGGMYGGKYSTSVVITACVGIFREDLDKGIVSQELLNDLEAKYLIHRSREIRTTSALLHAPALDDIDKLAVILNKAGLAYVYHGKSPNRKMICVVAYYYILHTYINP